jgi:hypothetical protein
MDMDTERLFNLLERIAQALERMAPCESAPNLTYDLGEFKTFDWQAIGASVEVADQYGPAIVVWQGNRFTRRSPENAYNTAIFYSRCVGKEGDRNLYERLITFKELPKNARPISREAEAKIQNH